jgi:hypothetical protein
MISDRDGYIAKGSDYKGAMQIMPRPANGSRIVYDQSGRRRVLRRLTRRV